MGLSRILQYRNPKPGDFLERRGHSIKMHGHNGLHTRSFALSHERRIDVESFQRDIHENRLCSDQCNRHGGCRGADSRNKNLIAGFHAHRLQANHQRIRAGRERNSVRSPAVPCKILFECIDRRPENVPSSAQHPRDGCIDLFAQRLATESDVIEFHLERSPHPSG